MVRSKFPGKPSKIVNRKIVNSSKYSLQQDNESTKAAENISYGLAVFNEVFGDNEQVLTAFHGFSPHDIGKSQVIARKQWEKVHVEYDAHGVAHKPEDAILVKLDAPTEDAMLLAEASLESIGPVGRHTTRAQCQSLILDCHVDLSKSAPPSRYFLPFKGNLKKHVANRLLQRAKRSTIDGSSMNRMLLSSQLDKNGTANAAGMHRKFVLPSRSIRSSRVIKPNKRFLDSEECERESSSQAAPNDHPLRSRIIELKKPRLILDDSNDYPSVENADSKCLTSDISFASLPCNVSLAQNCISGSADVKQHWKHVSLGELNVFGAPTSHSNAKSSICVASATFTGNNSRLQPNLMGVPSPSKVPVKGGPLSSKSKFILRESKLNINMPLEKLPEGVFSKKPKKGLALKSTGAALECGVCGAVRFYRFVKQANKFGINSCDSCRKFVARMIIKARSSENSISCEKGQGNCAITLALNKNESVSSKVRRCFACWLLMCIQRFVSMPEQTRDSLIRMLPANMQGMTVIVPTVPCFSKHRKPRRPRHEDTPQSAIDQSPKLHQASPGGKRKLPTPMSRIRRKAALVSFGNNMRRVRNRTASPTTSPSASSGKNDPVNIDRLDKGSKVKSKVKKLSNRKKSKIHPKSTDTPGKKATFKTLEKGKDGLLRQKLSLKGPRVKHVCRSASIVLGQPLATFPANGSRSNSNLSASNIHSDFEPMSTEAGPCASSKSKSSHEEKRDESQNDSQKPSGITSSKLESSVEIEGLKDPQINQPIISAAPTPEPERKMLCKSASNSSITQANVVSRRNSGLSSVSSAGFTAGFQKGHRRTLQSLGVYNTQLDYVPEVVSLDFWESYDLDEVCNTGFGLIGCDPFNIKPVCFLCGSAGKQKLIHCASCCEPYHQFCVEMGVLGGPAPSPLSGSEWRVDWVCPRCTVCHGCGRSTGHQLTSCQRCHHSYHLDCLGSTALRKNTGDRLWICSSCLRCKSCNSAVVTKFVGNLPFCKVCFKLRQKGNFCPLCQGCYADDDYQSKMMECAECKAWVHAKCEGLSDEKYQVLSYLPESVEFICRLCCAFPPAPWWLAVEAELQAGYINIIKAITKNRKACAMLKWSPRKTCNCHQTSAQILSKPSNASVLLGKRRLFFNYKVKEMEIQIPPSTLSRASLQQSDSTGLSARNKSIPSVFEFDDDIDGVENVPIGKYINSKEKQKSEPSQLHGGNDGSENQDKGVQYSPNAGSQSDSGIGSTDDELKACSAAEEEDFEEKCVVPGQPMECFCSNRELRYSPPSLLTIKKKVHTSEYSSLLEFHRDMDQLISEADSHEVKELYHQTLQEVFPWFDPKYTRVSRNSLSASPCKPHHGSLLQYQPDSSPDKCNGISSSIKILERLIPKDVDGLDDSYFYCGMDIKDERVCCLCKMSGDSAPYDEGRLLYCGQNDWVHVNCALWSAEVYEEIDGALQNVTNAMSRGRMIRCSECGKKGASVGCCAKKCEETLHFPCARNAGFVFMEDKNVYCPLHRKDAPGKPLTKPADFDICRPVFVELDRRKKKSVESKHVRVMIGSLFVESMGTIVPELSDLGSMIMPTEYSCTRLFWSSKEPWRVVQYTIRTTVRLPVPEPVLDLGHHVTVDHSKEREDPDVCDATEAPQSVVQGHEIILNQNESPSERDDVEAVVAQLLDTVCSKEADEEVSDAQNSADLLPPELTDAIFEDLPHDLLDGISMQDIFQDKFLSFEELGKEDSKDEASASEASGSAGCMKEHPYKDKSKIARSIKAVRELKRSKSDVLPSSSSQTANRLHQRSCSLAWSCKLGTNISCCKGKEGVVDRTRLIQELRLSVKPASSVELRYRLQDTGDKGKENQSLSWPRIMQVDGICDTSGSESSDVEDVIPSRRSSDTSLTRVNLNAKFAKDSELLWNRIQCLKKVTSAALSKNPAYMSRLKTRKNVESGGEADKRKSNWRKGSRLCAEDKRRNDSKVQLIPQLDGATDFSSDSDHEATSNVQFTPQGDEKPVRCNRCRCTYRTEESYARHLPNCTGDYSLTTSESEAEVSEDEALSNKKCLTGLDQNPTPSPDSAISISSGSQHSVSAVSPTTLPITPASSVCLASGAGSQSRPMMTSANLSSIMVVDSPSVKSCTVTVLDKPAQRVFSNADAYPKPSKPPAQRQLKVLVKGSRPPALRYQPMEQTRLQGVMQQPMQHTIQSSHPQHPPVIMLDYPQAHQSAPSVLVQTIPSSAMVPAYLEAFQQHTGQNLQYLATVDPSGGFGKTQFLAAVPSSVVPGAYQLQAVQEQSLCIDPNTMGLTALPGIQLAPAQITPHQQQVLGTLIQSPLSIATTEPIYETIQMYPDANGGVLLTSQPMLTCMETVVSNTYMSMSSSQFLSSSVPGMLQGSSTYSTTTTQVFQASKVDPPVVDVPAQYVVVNPHSTLQDQNGSKMEVVSVAQHPMHEAAPLQTQMPSINLPVPASVPAPLPPQTLPPVIPTSIVPPMPRIQPQRTYSKPVKTNKELKAAGFNNASASNAVNKLQPGFTSQESASSVCTKAALGAQAGHPKLVVGSDTTDPTIANKFTHETSLSAGESSAAAQSESITTSVAPAQSITLPDPITSKLLVDEVSNPAAVSAGSALGAAGRCPPVTFSYRSHMVGNSKLKTGSAQRSSLSSKNSKSIQSSSIAIVKSPTGPVKAQTGKLSNASLRTTSGQPLIVISPKSNGQPLTVSTPVSAALTPICSQPSPSVPNSTLISSTLAYKSPPSSQNMKPVATIVPQTLVSSVSISLPSSSPCEVTSLSRAVTSCVVSSPFSGLNSIADPTSNSPSVTSWAGTTKTPVSLLCHVASTTAAMPSAVCPSSVGSEMILCSLPTSFSVNCSTTSVCNTVTSTIPSATVSCESTSSPLLFSPVKTTAGIGGGIKPLQEIKQANVKNVEGNASPVKNQEKLLISVPPTVLKSTSRNIDSNNKNDLFCKQAEIPILLPNGEKSPSSLKLLFQKQAHNGCYKVSSSPVKKDGELTLMKLADINIISMKEKKGGKDESENVKPIDKVCRKGQSNPSIPQLMYEIQGQDGFSYSSPSMSDVWQKVFDAVQEAREKHKMPPLLHNPFGTSESAPNLLGLGNNSLKYLMEQLRRVEDCTKYRPIYHKSRLPGPGFKRDDQDAKLKESNSGCARTDPCISVKKYDMFSWLDSRHRCPPKLLESNDFDFLSSGRRVTSTNLPIAMRFRHLRETSKTSVGVFRSDIHGRGLFCLRDIEAGEMVIEYAGEVIRNTLTDNRERYYQSKGIDCYMFKVDDNFTVDATRKGNAARFINHSCEPNCYSRVVDIHGKKHIIIFAFRRIPQGEELTYDYKFPIEDVKIACHCLAPRCRKYLN